VIPENWFPEAAARINPHIIKTPCILDTNLDTYIKWENRQVTGSFKVRGALNKVLSLQPWERQNGLVAASAGNHGQGVALAGRLTNSTVTIFAPDHAVPIKVEAMRSLGAEVVFVPGGYELAEQKGRQYAEEKDLTWISPYNDGQVMAGQGTVGLELIDQIDIQKVKCCVIPVGGGGLISGVGAILKKSNPEIQLIGVQAASSPFFYHQFYYQTQNNAIDHPSLADGLTGAIEPDSLTIPLVKQLVDDILLVSESEIEQAIGYCWKVHQQRVEGSGAVVIAAMLSGRIAQRPAIAIVSGGNIQPEIWMSILEKSLQQ
jgi:threonine dehydratase